MVSASGEGAARSPSPYATYMADCTAMTATMKARHARIKDGLLYYFVDASDAAPVKGCIALRGAAVDEEPAVSNHAGSSGFVLRSPLPRRPGRPGGSEWVLGGAGETRAAQVLAILRRFM